MAIQLIHFNKEVPKENAFTKFYLTILKQPDRVKLNHIITDGFSNGDYWSKTKREPLFHRWFDYIVDNCFYDENPDTKVIRKRISVKENGDVVGQILCEVIRNVGFRVEYFDTDDKENERHNDFLVSKLFAKNLELAFDSFHDNITYKTRKNDFVIDREKGIGYLVDVIMDRYPNFKTIFDTIHGYRERSKWLKENVDFEEFNNSKLPKGIDSFEYSERYWFDFNIHYTDDKRTSSWNCSWFDLERILYEKYGTKDVIGKEIYTDHDVFEMLKNEITVGHGSGIEKYHERKLKKYEEFIEKKTDKKERVKWISNEFGTGGYGSPMHKHEYGICGNNHDSKGYELHWEDVKGRHAKMYSWNTVDDIILDYVKSLREEK